MSRTDTKIYSEPPSLQPHQVFDYCPPYTPMAGSRVSGPPSYYESYPFATPEKEQRIYNRNADPAAMASSITLSNSTDPRVADIKLWSCTLDRMHDARLDKQRYVMSGHKSEEVSKLALGAKVERALARRMVGQDASFRSKDAATQKLDEEKRRQ